MRDQVRFGGMLGDFAVYDVIYRLATEPTPFSGPVPLQSAAVGFSHV
jgi:hypothetical protein